MPQDWDSIPGQKGRCYTIVGRDKISGNPVEVATLQGFECIFINITRILTPLAGLALFVMLIVGAFKFLTSGGDPKQTQEAGKTITFAVVGIVLFLGIWFILTLIKTITGVDVTKFAVPGGSNP